MLSGPPLCSNRAYIEHSSILLYHIQHRLLHAHQALIQHSHITHAARLPYTAIIRVCYHCVNSPAFGLFSTALVIHTLHYTTISQRYHSSIPRWCIFACSAVFNTTLALHSQHCTVVFPCCHPTNLTAHI